MRPVPARVSRRRWTQALRRATEALRHGRGVTSILRTRSCMPFKWQLRRVFELMGSMGPDNYAVCSFCQYRVYNAYLFDGQGDDFWCPAMQDAYAMCDWCWDYLIPDPPDSREVPPTWPGDERHWWSNRRWGLDRTWPPIVEETFPMFPDRVHAILVDFLAEW